MDGGSEEDLDQNENFEEMQEIICPGRIASLVI